MNHPDKTHNHSGWTSLRLLMLLLLVAGSQRLAAAGIGDFQAPVLESFIFHGETDGDGNGDGVNETHIRRYLNQAGDSVFSMTTGDRLWAWSLNTKNSDDSDQTKNYVIRNSNCDGIFDERYGLDEEFHVPACLTSN